MPQGTCIYLYFLFLFFIFIWYLFGASSKSSHWHTELMENPSRGLRPCDRHSKLN